MVRQFAAFSYDGCNAAHPKYKRHRAALETDAHTRQTEAWMAWRQHRWFRRWLIVIVFWAVPVAIVAVREIREKWRTTRRTCNSR